MKGKVGYMEQYSVSCEGFDFVQEANGFQDAIERAVKFIKLRPGEVVTMEFATGNIRRRVDVKIALEVVDV